MTPRDPLTHEVDAALRELERRVAAVSAQPATDVIFGRARRRRTNRILAVGAALLVALVLGGSYAVAGRPWSAPQPAESRPPSPAPAPVTGVRQDPARQVPDGFLLYETGEVERGSMPPVPVSCWGHPVLNIGISPEPVGRTRITQDLHVYADAATAAGVFRTVRADLAGCMGFPDSRGRPTSLPGVGHEAMALTTAKPADGSGDFTGAPTRMVVVRVGPALATFFGFPAIPEIDAQARQIVGRLCLFDPQCRPRPGLPAPLAALTADGHAWAVVLATQEPGDRSRPLGPAVAAAAELGYHASVVFGTCDEGVQTALGLRSPQAAYAVVYFTGQAEARAFGAALTSMAVWVIPVVTHCV